MKLVNFENPVTNDWLIREGHRLDAPPFLSGAVEAKIALEKIDVPTQKLKEVTTGFNGGIYNGPQFKRNYVTSSEHGVPFMTASSILLADMSQLPLLSRKDALSNKLSHLRIEEGMTLISCSGSIGRMAYARPEMAGVWSSQDVLKVVPNPDVIPPGYLYAYLSSKYGKTFVTSGTYGAVIQHLEPQHIADLPVPRLGVELEGKVHKLVAQAGQLRSEASAEILDANARIMAELPECTSQDLQEVSTAVVSSADLLRTDRFDGYFYNATALRIQSLISGVHHSKLGDICEVYDVPPFKHIYVEDDHGIAFFTSAELFLLDLTPQQHLSLTRTKGLDKYRIPPESVLIARSGQLGGNIGRAVISGGLLEDATTSDHVIRVVPKGRSIHYGYLLAYLSSWLGYNSITRYMCGKSVPALWPIHLREMLIPRLASETEESIGESIGKAFEKRHSATAREQKAITIVEQAIEAHSHSRG